MSTHIFVCLSRRVRGGALADRGTDRRSGPRRELCLRGASRRAERRLHHRGLPDARTVDLHVTTLRGGALAVKMDPAEGVVARAAPCGALWSVVGAAGGVQRASLTRPMYSPSWYSTSRPFSAARTPSPTARAANPGWVRVPANSPKAATM